VAGLLAGIWDAGLCIVGILLDSLAAYALWLALYLKRRPGGAGDYRMLAKSFIGISFGVWGFIAMFRAITIRDTAFFAASFALLKYVDLSDLVDVAGGLDEDSVLFILVLLAAALLLTSLFFLAQILIAMPAGQVASIVACVAALRVVEIFNDRRSGDEEADKAAVAERNMAELCLHVFVKGWFGALLMYVIAFSTLPMGWAYLVWSYAHDLVLRPWLWRVFGPHVVSTGRAAALPA
jgi:hypothetical protein